MATISQTVKEKQALKELIDHEIAMVKKNRWLSEREKFLKVKELNKLLNPDK